MYMPFLSWHPQDIQGEERDCMGQERALMCSLMPCVFAWDRIKATT